MNRHPILVALLAILLAACGTQTADEADATLTPEPTAEPASEPTESPDATDEPEATDDDGGSTGSLDDMIPDELNGVAGIPIPGMDQILSGALEAQGLDAGEAEFAFVTYGDDENAVVLNAFRIPGVSEVAMEQLGRLMAGADPSGEFEAETTEIGGKTVLSFSSGGQPGVVYFYVADDVAFTVAGQEASAVEQLLAELP